MSNATDTPQNEGPVNPYGYQPLLYVCVTFVTLFGLSTVAHIGQAIWKRKWYLLPTVVLGGCGEVIGTTIISPTFLAAANFIILGTIINRLGEQYSRLPSAYYGILFVTVDVVALAVQAIGGGMASAALQSGTGNPDKGGHIMLVGIVIQLVGIIVYVVLAMEFFSNCARHKPVRSVEMQSFPASYDAEKASISPADDCDDLSVMSRPEDGEAKVASRAGLEGDMYLTGKMKLMCCGLAFSTLALFIRSVYRTIELSNGWSGRIIQTQVYFNVLDGAMIVMAMYTLNFIHPGFLL